MFLENGGFWFGEKFKLGKIFELYTHLFILDFCFQSHQFIMSFSQIFHIAWHTIIRGQFHFELIDNDSNYFEAGQSDLNRFESFHIERRVGPDAIPRLNHLVQFGLFYREKRQNILKSG